MYNDYSKKDLNNKIAFFVRKMGFWRDCKDCAEKSNDIQQKNTVINSKDKEISEKNAEINKKNALIKEKENEIIKLQKEIHSSAAEKESIIKAKDAAMSELTRKLNTSTAQKDALITKKYKEMENITQNIKILIAQNEQEKKTKNEEIDELKTEFLTSELKHSIEKNQLIEQLKEFEKKVEDTTEEIKKIENAKNDKEVKGTELPGLSIIMDSLLSLNDSTKGWKIEHNDKLQEIMGKKMVFVSVLGMYDVGKSWVCNKLSNSEQYSSGYAQTTNALNFVFPTSGKSIIALADTPGSNEVIRVTDKDLLKMIKERADTPENPKEKYFWNYKQLKNDSKILQDLKEKFISLTSDVVILICNKVSDKEQEMIYKVINNHQEVWNNRNKEAGKNSSTARASKLYVVHNYKNLTSKEQVEEQIQKDIFKSFDISEESLFACDNGNPQLKDCNQIMYRDQFGVDHLVLACNNTPAGDHYNPSTFARIKEALMTMDNRTIVNIPKTFFEFCKEAIPRILKRSDNLKLVYDETRGVIHKDSESEDIVLENAQYDKLGNFFFRSTFEPRCEARKRCISAEQEEVRVRAELLDSDFKAKIDKDPTGCTILRLKGEKKNEIADFKDGKAEKSIYNTREVGEFDSKITLSKNKELLAYEKLPPENGIHTYVFKFGPNRPIDV